MSDLPPLAVTAGGWSPPSYNLPGPYSGYELLCPVGAGGRGWVWMADAPREHPNLVCAVKFHADALRDDVDLSTWIEHLEDVQRIEAPFLARLHRVLDLRPFRGDGWPGVATVSQLIEPTLERVLLELESRRESLPPGLVYRWARHLFEGVEALHGGYRCAHNRIKPSNVFLRLGEGKAFRGPASLEDAVALLGDLTAICAIGAAPHPWSNRERTPDFASVAGDLRALGLTLKRVVAAADTGASALRRAVVHLVGSASEQHASAGRELRGLLFPTEEIRHAGGESAVILRRSEVPDHGSLAVETGVPRPGRGAAGLSRSGSEFEGVPGFVLIRSLGQGGMGSVYEARDLALNRLVAIKVIHPHLCDRDLVFRERFRREIHAMARLTHPNIASIYGSGFVNGREYLVQELVSGETLRERVQREGPLPFGETARIMADVADAIAFAHAQDVLHRDIKPGNIMLTPEGTPKLIDFGLAKLADASALSISGQMMGTMGYMSPEQMAGERVDGRTDVFGLGATLYCLLTGVAPFQGRHPAQLYEEMQREAFSVRGRHPSLPPLLAAICLRCLRYAPAERFASAAELAEALRQALPEALRQSPPHMGSSTVPSTAAPAMPLPRRAAVRRPAKKRKARPAFGSEKQRILSPIRETHGRHLEDCFDRAIATAPDSVRQVYQLRETGLTFAEIAEALDLPLRPLIAGYQEWIEATRLRLRSEGLSGTG